ncbi:MAG: VCBS repeat-containing protein [Nanoarchaeota archaeon]|nr:VCBS repeat-containing protein [Nanoarchaeota archaeon]
MKLYQKIATYTFIGAASLGLFGCDKKDSQRATEQPLPAEMRTYEVSPYVFGKSKINYDHLPNLGWSDMIGVTCGDLDGDGDLEVIVATKDGLTIYENRTEQKR